MKKILLRALRSSAAIGSTAALAAALIFSAPYAIAQFPGLLPSGYVWGNAGASEGQALPTALSALFDRAFCSTQGSAIGRGASTWTCASSTVPIPCPIISTAAGTCNNGNAQANNGTYTTPAGAKYLLVEGCGAGGGAGGNGTAGASNGGTGGNTTFGTLTANGGVGGNLATGTPAANTAGGGTATNGDWNIQGGAGQGSYVDSGGTGTGGKGGESPLGGGGLGASAGTATAGSNAQANSCSGGGGPSGASGVVSGGGGGAAGGYFRKIIGSPSATYSYAIGAGGTAGGAGTSGAAGGLGGAGFISVTAYFQ